MKHKTGSMREPLAILLALCTSMTMPVLADDNALTRGAKTAGHAVGSAAHEVGEGAKHIGKTIGKEAKEVGKTIGHAAKEGGKEFRCAVKGKC